MENVEESEGKKGKKKSENKNAVKFPIGVKLSIIIGSVVLISLGLVTALNSYFVGKDVRRTAENSNLTQNASFAKTVEEKIGTVRSNVYQLLDLRNAAGSSSRALSKQAETFFFERNADIASVDIVGTGEDVSRNQNILNQQFFISNELETSSITSFFEQSQEIVERSVNGETIATNSSPFFGMSMISLFFPYKENGLNQTCVITFSLDSIAEIIGTDSVNTTFLINDTDELLFHPETERVLRAESMDHNPLVLEMRSENQNGTDSKQIVFTENSEDGKERQFYGAFCKITVGDICVLTTVPVDYIMEGVYTTFKNNVYLTLIVFFVSIIIVLFFSRFSISKPLRRITAVAEEIMKGNFEKSLLENLVTKKRDEIGVLNQSTREEVGFLNTFSKFTNKNVAKAIARNELDFNPHLKDITIFFSDIRGFTAISDGFKNKFKENSPKEIIGFLNDYMGRMVECVTLSHGNIDKFEGDAIMAVWGILREDSLDFENLPDFNAQKKALAREHLDHVKEDAINAIRGTIAMRYALMKYNKDAEAFTLAHKNEPLATYKPHIRIGCGLNTGRATCGLMGSADKMEYTAIGDSVNFASRTESSNKPCGTDILITQDVYDLLKEQYIKCEENHNIIKPEYKKDEIVVERIPVEFEVKGKGAQHFYGVVNMPGFDIEEFFKQGNPDFKADADCLKAVGRLGPKTLNEVRTMLGIPIPDFEKVNLNEEENKITVKQ